MVGIGWENILADDDVWVMRSHDKEVGAPGDIQDIVL